jgi:hypothetical protein
MGSSDCPVSLERQQWCTSGGSILWTGFRAQLGSNISANCISAANDLNAMFPRVGFCLPENGRARLTTIVVYQSPARQLLCRIHRRMGSGTMEHLSIGICTVELHGRLHYIRKHDRSPTYVHAILTDLSAGSNYRHSAG